MCEEHWRDNTAAMGNAKANTENETFSLTEIPVDSLLRLGLIFNEGALKYGRGNWRNGVSDQEFQIARANKALKHLLYYIHKLETGENFDESDDDQLAKVMWFCVIMMELERLEGMSDRRQCPF